jgi:hypothetical protein
LPGLLQALPTSEASSSRNPINIVSQELLVPASKDVLSSFQAFQFPSLNLVEEQGSFPLQDRCGGGQLPCNISGQSRLTRKGSTKSSLRLTCALVDRRQVCVFQVRTDFSFSKKETVAAWRLRALQFFSAETSLFLQSVL